MLFLEGFGGIVFFIGFGLMFLYVLVGGAESPNLLQYSVPKWRMVQETIRLYSNVCMLFHCRTRASLLQSRLQAETKGSRRF
jgi:hypothetical protein